MKAEWSETQARTVRSLRIPGFRVLLRPIEGLWCIQIESLPKPPFEAESREEAEREAIDFLKEMFGAALARLNQLEEP